MKKKPQTNQFQYFRGILLEILKNLNQNEHFPQKLHFGQNAVFYFKVFTICNWF